jgi:hypothetical protein
MKHMMALLLAACSPPSYSPEVVESLERFSPGRTCLEAAKHSSEPLAECLARETRSPNVTSAQPAQPVATRWVP